MPNNLGDYLAKKASELGLERQDQLSVVQRYLEQRYPEQTRAISFHNGDLTILTPSSAVASEVRYSQMQILADLKETLPELKKIVIKIRSL